MKFKKLNEVIERWIPLCSDEIKQEFFDAVALDVSHTSDYDLFTESSSVVDKEWILFKYNQIFNRKSRIISQAVLKKYKLIFEAFTKEEVEIAMSAAKKDEFHIETKFRYCTIEYFSRVDQMDKWLNIGIESFQKKKFDLPKFNVKENV